MFPIVIELLGHHGLEPSAEEGVDYHKFLLIRNENHMPNLGVAFRIVATNVKID